MTLQSSGSISLNDIAGEFGGSVPHSLSEYYRSNGLTTDNNTGVPTSGLITFSDFYGAQTQYTLTSAGNVNGEAQRQEITVSNFISSGGIFIIPSNIWVWSDDTTTAALIVDIACTIKNYGKVIGKGGVGSGWTGSGNNTTTAGNGGPAISVTASGVSITNYSGAFIAGGGGGGGAAVGSGNATGYAGGGGGAGGGVGGRGSASVGGAGGALNASGSDATGTNSWNGIGGGAGGSGGFAGVSSSDNNYGNYGGGGGGRILPGVGGENDATNTGTIDGRGGSAGGAGDSGSTGGNSGHAGGGGGWGANGGNGDISGGSGGAAIAYTTAYTLSNSGTVYGAT